jgi:L-lactate dehydrogenase complex protein LldG
MTTREEMLERVRKALGRPQVSAGAAPPSALDLTGVMPSLAPEEYQAKFQAEWEKVAGVAHRVATIEELKAVLQKILAGSGTHAVVLSRNPLLTELRIADRLRAAGKVVTSWAGDSTGAAAPSLAQFDEASFQAGVGITGVEWVLAETGSLVLTSLTEGAQITSLAPPVHVALYRRSQLVGSLDEVLAKLAVSHLAGQTSPGRSLVIVTGTSRTADIEQILIHGVHGPREAHAILVEENCR